MKKDIVIASMVVGIVTFASLLELVYPSPKMHDYCQQVSCRLVAQDILVGKYKDYRGQLMPYFFGIFILGILCTGFALQVRQLRRFLIIGLALLSIAIVDGILIQLFIPFSMQPALAWAIAGFIIIVSLFYLFIQHTARHSQWSSYG